MFLDSTDKLGLSEFMDEDRLDGLILRAQTMKNRGTILALREF